jgi:hypothetical protein
VTVFDLREDQIGLLLFVASALGRDDELAAAVVGVGAPLHGFFRTWLFTPRKPSGPG